MNIDKGYLETQKADALRQRDQIIHQLGLAEGYLQVLDSMLQRIDAPEPEKPEKPVGRPPLTVIDGGKA